MVRGTTPTLTLHILDDNIDLTQATNVYLTIKQDNYTLTKTTPQLELSSNIIDCYLTQEESLRFSEGTAEVQVNWTYQNNGTVYRAATKIKTIQVGPQLLTRVVS